MNCELSLLILDTLSQVKNHQTSPDENSVSDQKKSSPRQTDQDKMVQEETKKAVFGVGEVANDIGVPHFGP